MGGRDRRHSPTPATKTCRRGPRLEDDKQRPAKQRHTAKRIFERLREEHGFTGGYTIVKDYVRSAELHSRGDVHSSDPCARRSAGGLRRSTGDDCRLGAEGALPGDGPAALGRLLRRGVSGRDLKRTTSNAPSSWSASKRFCRSSNQADEWAERSRTLPEKRG